jgi:RNA polymerase sigma factor (sigma-70 family)
MAPIDLSEDEQAEAIDIARRVARPQLGKDRVDDLEDVAQEAILRLLTQDPPPENWRAWLNVTVSRLAMDVHRAGRRLMPQDDGSRGEAQELRRFIVEGIPASFDGMMSLNLNFMLEPLNERDRNLLWSYVRGDSAEELAKEFGFASPAVATQTVFRIREKLQKHLTNADFNPGHPRPY